uniref:ITPR-interacting domain-containing protein n=1 Tax=Anolis carolinensis TaxID=28377 RepID=A0A803TP44_ANOCA
MASSAISSSTNKTTSSISEVLDLCEVDVETILCNLGFIQEEPQATSWIPARFFSVPSQAKGIDFQLFLRAQVQRIEMEDPCLILASECDTEAVLPELRSQREDQSRAQERSYSQVTKHMLCMQKILHSVFGISLNKSLSTTKVLKQM